MADFSVASPPIGPETEGALTNPTSGDTVCDSGTVPNTGLYRAYVGVNCTAAATFTIQRRNTANSGTVGDALVKYVTGTAQYVYLFKLEAGERLRVVMGANLTGLAAGDIWLEQRA
jgi:hypothetical protein